MLKVERKSGSRTENPSDRSMSRKRKKMSDIKKEIKETVKGMAEVAFDAVERLTFQGSAKPEPKKEFRRMK